MPELPEVETMRRGVASIAGCTIRDCQKPRSRLQSIEITPDFRAFRRRAIGRTIAVVARLGKRIVLELDSADRIVIEPRMSGSVILANPRDRKHLRLIFELTSDADHTKQLIGSQPPDKNGGQESLTFEVSQSRLARDGLQGRSRPFAAAGGVGPAFTPGWRPRTPVVRPVDGPPVVDSPMQLLFWDQRGLGVVRLVSPTEFESRYGRDKIGPDALQISASELRDRLKTSRRAVKVALLDQKAVAGIGNIYASELLHRVRIHPATPCNRLTPRQWTKLHAAMLEVLQEALQHQGSTLADNVYATPEGNPGQYAFRVYQRHGHPCSQCHQANIERIVQAQRSTFFCPACQGEDKG